MKRLTRIEGFLKSLEDKGIITAEMQSMVFSPDFGMLGGDNYGDGKNGCSNDSAACKGLNKGCTNIDACSPTAINIACHNTNASLPVCKPTGSNPIKECGTGDIGKNIYTQSCGG